MKNKDEFDKNQSLSEISKKDNKWVIHKNQSDKIGTIYKNSEYNKYSERMEKCAEFLLFGNTVNSQTGELEWKLRNTHFCRVRYCPVCQWRRSLLWQARFFQKADKIMNEFSNVKWLFLTLTIRNVEITDLKETIKHMNNGWKKLTKRKQFRPIKGWVRSIEVTRDKNGLAHPHFHCLLMVPSYWFNTNYYVKHSKWVELWRSCCQLNYDPNVDIRIIKKRDNKKNDFKQAVSETLKYSTKPSDMEKEKSWFLELTKQTLGLRFIASGGVLKNVLKIDEESTRDLIGDGDGIDDGRRYAFEWLKKYKNYYRNSKYDF